MTEDRHLKTGVALDQFTGKRGMGTGGELHRKISEDDFPGDFAKLK